MRFARQLLWKVCAFVSLTVFCSGLLTASFFPVHASSLNTASALIAANSSMVDKALGEGTANKIEGKTRQGQAAVEQGVKEAQAKAEAAMKQSQGKAQANFGEVQNRADEAGSDLDEASDNIVDAVKDFFGQ